MNVEILDKLELLSKKVTGKVHFWDAENHLVSEGEVTPAEYFAVALAALPELILAAHENVILKAELQEAAADYEGHEAQISYLKTENERQRRELKIANAGRESAREFALTLLDFCAEHELEASDLVLAYLRANPDTPADTVGEVEDGQ